MKIVWKCLGPRDSGSCRGASYLHILWDETAVLIQNQMQMQAKGIDDILRMRIPDATRKIAILSGDAMLWHFALIICEKKEEISIRTICNTFDERPMTVNRI